MCGNKVSIEGIYIRWKIRCGAYVESQYYNPLTNATSGLRFLTDDVCAICFIRDDLVPAEEIRQKRDTGGKNPFPICRYFFFKI